MNGWIVRARFLLESLGWPVVPGLAALVFAGAWHHTVVMPLQADVDAMNARVVRLRSVNAAPRAPDRGAEDPKHARMLDAVLGNLPRLQTAPARVSELHAQAMAHGLVLETGDYQMSPDVQAGLIRYRIRLPVKGGYVPMREFVAAARDGIPVMTLDEFQVRRSSVAQGDVEGRIGFSMLFAEER